MNEKEVTSLNEARLGVIALDAFKPYLEEEKKTVIAKLKNQFRSNVHDLSVYVGLVSTLVSLDDIEAKMLRKINAGKEAGKKAVL